MSHASESSLRVFRLRVFAAERVAGLRSNDGVELMGTGDGSVWNAVDRRRGVSATAVAAPARSEAIGGELSSADVVDGRVLSGGV